MNLSPSAIEVLQHVKKQVSDAQFRLGKNKDEGVRTFEIANGLACLLEILLDAAKKEGATASMTQDKGNC